MAEILGAEIDEEGFLLKMADWSEEIALAMAAEDDIELSYSLILSQIAEAKGNKTV